MGQARRHARRIVACHRQLQSIGAAPSGRREVEPQMATKKTDKASFQADVLQASKPVVVDFWAEWCGPCKMIAPSLEEISEENDAVQIVKVNIDDNPDLAAQFGVRSIPTLMLFKDGQQASVQVGAAPKSKLVAWINSNLSA